MHPDLLPLSTPTESYKARVCRTKIATGPRDCHQTPAWAVEAALTTLCPSMQHIQRFVEPCAGEGAFVRGLKARGHTVIAVEVRTAARPYLEVASPAKIWIGSWFDYAKALKDAKVDCRDLGVIGNPPYTLAQAFIESCRDLGFCYIAFLLRLGFLASRQRRDFWRQHPLTGLYVFERRPSFTEDGSTDATEYAIFEWARGKPKLPIGWIRALAYGVGDTV